MAFITCTPAYGRDYKSQKAVKEAWKAGQDFQINCFGHPDDGRYVNIHDAKGSGDTFNIRYDNNRKVLPIRG